MHCEHVYVGLDVNVKWNFSVNTPCIISRWHVGTNIIYTGNDLDVYVKWNFSVNSVASSCLWIPPGVVPTHGHTTHIKSTTHGHTTREHHHPHKNTREHHAYKKYNIDFHWVNNLATSNPAEQLTGREKNVVSVPQSTVVMTTRMKIVLPIVTIRRKSNPKACHSRPPNPPAAETSDTLSSSSW